LRWGIDKRIDLRSKVYVIDARDAHIAELEAIIVKLQARIIELESKLGQNSSNSSRPPSSDTPQRRGNRNLKRVRSGRKRGAQRGHAGHRRELIPENMVSAFHDCFPKRCKCGQRLPRVVDSNPIRHQVVELPEIRPQVDEYRQHRVQCECGEVSCGQLPAGVPTGMVGPRLNALIGLLTGSYRISRRQAVSLLDDVLGMRISLGALSQAEGKLTEVLSEPVHEAHQYTIEQSVKNVDATGWKQNGVGKSLWTIATTLVTVFVVTHDATEKTVKQMLGKLRGILITDRGRQFGFWAMDKRQICWAHLIRKFVSFSESSNEAVSKLGDELLLFSQVLFDDWYRFRAGEISRARLQRETELLRICVENLLAKGRDLELRGVSGSCRDILNHREALWTFLDKNGVEPTNNHAERELRGFVLWRKNSFGSQSERGTRYAERIMTVVHTLRKQNRNVFAYLTAACQAALIGTPIPSLLPNPP
jgi:transposase